MEIRKEKDKADASIPEEVVEICETCCRETVTYSLINGGVMCHLCLDEFFPITTDDA